MEKVSRISKLKVLIIVYSLFIGFLPSDAASESSIQSYLVHTLNSERYSTGTYLLPKLPIATNMLQLEFDEELRKIAQDRAEDCLKHLEQCRPEKEEANSQVNISVKKYSKDVKDTVERRLALVIMDWTRGSQIREPEELLQFVTSNTPLSLKESLHNFANVLYADFWKVGCGFADKISDEQFDEVLVCHFGPGKRESGKELYRVGCTACSDCPIGSSCLVEYPYNDKLCKVNLGEKPKPTKREKSEVVCDLTSTQPSVTTPKEIWTGRVEDGMQECYENSCSPGWDNSRVSIDVKGECKFSIAFKEKIYIDESSCFKFYYNMSPSGSLTNEVIAFAVKADSGGKDIEKSGKYDKANNVTYLDIPWSNVYIHVGFGTRSQSKQDDYTVMLRNSFIISSGKCPSI